MTRERGRERMRRMRRRAVWLLLLAGPLAWACTGSTRKSPAMPPQTLSAVPPPETQGESPAEDPETPSPPEPTPGDEEDPTVVTIESAEVDAPGTLAEVAERERQRREEEGDPVVVITDENLAEHATGALTIAAEESGAAAETPETDDAGEEAYWRSRILEVRLRWRDAVDEVAELQQEANALRYRFYAEDDPYRRDAYIKPTWDRVLDRLALAKELARSGEEEVQRILEEGRRAGALPGWLREGIELEPTEEELPDAGLESAEPREPPVAEEDGEGS